jgi:capsular polysaccharide biosynthesis protein
LEASETGRRIFWRHRWLLLVLMILPAVGVVALKESQPVTYAATAVIQGQGMTPDTTTQVSAIQSRVASVASDPALVQAALTKAKVNRNASQLARHNVSVTPVGTSAIMDVTVTDQAPQVALATSASLATAVVNQLNQLSTGTGAALVSLPTDAIAASSHAAVYGALAGLLGLIVGLLLAALHEVLRPTVAQPDAGARELGAVLFGTAEERGDQIVALGRDLPERLNLAAHRAGVRTVVLTGPGSPDRLSSLAVRLRGRMSPLPADGSSLGGARIEADRGDNASRNGDARRPTIVGSEHRTVGLATTDWPAGVTAAQSAESQRTVVTLHDIRLGAPPPDAALVVVLPRFAPHSALDQAADLGVTADWPVLGVIGIRRVSSLAVLIDRFVLRNRPVRGQRPELSRGDDD